jgi:NADH dehydrogenase FAD-containing subunit
MSFAALAATLSVPVAHASTSAVQAAAQAQAPPAPITGELTQVDPDKKTITVKDTAGVETQFEYSDTTTVTGSQRNVEGLVTMSGSQVTVTFTVDGNQKMATKIEVRQKA